MLQMDFAFFNVETIHEFTSNFVAICSATSHPFGFTPRRKFPPIDILKFPVIKLRNHDNKVAFVRVEEYGVPERSSEFMKACNNINIRVKTTGRYASSLNGKSEITNKTLDNITISLLLNSSHKK